MRLPHELIEEILSYAGVSDLKQANLVCRSWSSACQRHLFHRVEIWRSDSARAETLEALLNDSPHIGRYVHDLSLDFTLKLMNSGTPTSMFRTFTDLTRLDARHLYWANMDSDRRDDISTMITPSLSELVLNECMFNTHTEFLAFLALGTGVEKLSLISVKFNVGEELEQMDGHEDVSASAQAVIIRDLHIASAPGPLLSYMIDERTQRYVDITRLQTFASLNFRNYGDVATRVLPAVAKNGTLEVLSLAMNLTCSDEPYFPLGDLNTLKHMSLAIKSDPQHCAGQWLTSLFSQVTGPMSLEEITIVVKLEVEDESYWETWADLGQNLSKAEYGQLRDLVLRVEKSGSNGFSPSALEQNNDKTSKLQALLHSPSRCSWKFNLMIR